MQGFRADRTPSSVLKVCPARAFHSTWFNVQSHCQWHPPGPAGGAGIIIKMPLKSGGEARKPRRRRPRTVAHTARGGCGPGCPLSGFALSGRLSAEKRVRRRQPRRGRRREGSANPTVRRKPPKTRTPRAFRPLSADEDALPEAPDSASALAPPPFLNAEFILSDGPH